MDTQKCKIVVVGDINVGKTSLILTFSQHICPKGIYLPNYLDLPAKFKVEVDGVAIELEIVRKFFYLFIGYF